MEKGYFVSAIDVVDVADSKNVPTGLSRARTRLVIQVALFAVAFGIGTNAVREFRATGNIQDFYQPEFGPAVLLACGRGFEPPDVASFPNLPHFSVSNAIGSSAQAFLSTFQCWRR